MTKPHTVSPKTERERELTVWVDFPVAFEDGTGANGARFKCVVRGPDGLIVAYGVGEGPGTNDDRRREAAKNAEIIASAYEFYTRPL